MLATNSLIELEPIIDDITAIINSIMGSLDSMHRKEASANELSQASSQLNQLKGIFTMLNMPGALALIEETMIAVNQLGKSNSDKKLTSAFSVISDALAILSRYIDYISQRNAVAPDLLLPNINQLRQINHKSPYKESVFFVIPNSIQKLQVTHITTETSDFGGSVLDLNLRKIRHLRQMFQVGLIEVIRRSNLVGGFKMMRRSLLRVHTDYSGHSLPDIWIIAQSMIEGYLTGGLTINNQRLKILSSVDRQYRLIEIFDPKKSQAEKSQAESNKALIGEMLYLVSLSQSQDKYTLNLKKKYELLNNRASEINFMHEISVLRGPTRKDLQSLSHEVLEELIRVESFLNTISEQGSGELKVLLSMVETLSSLLRVVQLEEESLRLGLITAILQKAIAQDAPISQSDLNISLEVVQLLRKVFEKHELSSLSPTTKVGRTDLTAEQQAACLVSSKHIKKAIQLFDSYFQEKQEPEALSAVAEALANAKGGMKALKLDKLVGITDDCIELVQAIISGQYSKNNRTVTVQFLADAIGSVEFYMETVGKNKMPSPRVLDFGLESIKELRLLAIQK
jgi:hypothetical protein